MRKYKKTTDVGWLDDLNQPQKDAVVSYKGPSLVLAGAGSGKTRVITYRIAYLIKVKKVSSQKILSLTFTNKAAEEMKSRLEDFLSLRARRLWMGTFHSIFARILRIEGSKLGLSPNFTIYDERDQGRLIKEIIESLHLQYGNFDPAIIRSIISKSKNKLVSPSKYIKNAESDFEKDIGEIYQHYNKRLEQNNALDFEDLLIKPIELFSKQKNVLNKYQTQFQYILVDEYQDTNKAQYKLLNLLALKNKNICVVGDDDQSIYGWRGAELSNIIDFEKDYPEAQIFKLEQNYRSTKNILRFAQRIIDGNVVRRKKTLWTEKEDGEKIFLAGVHSDRAEADFVVDKINEELFKNKKKPGSLSIFYRTNSQSRVFEERLRRNNIPYTIVGGVRFYERKEIKDILAYLKIIANPKDEVSILRIVNYPIRGIGKATLDKVKSFSQERGIELYKAFKNSDKIEGLDQRKKKKLLEFYNLIEKYRGLKEKFSLTELTRCLLDDTGILVLLKEEGSKESLSRLENIHEFLEALSDYYKTSDKQSLENYLQDISLVADIDFWDNKEDVVSLMTLHSAKGLEFPVVFLAGVEDNLIPYTTKKEDKNELEEERRLFYVGCTRAKEKLYLTYAMNRHRFGNSSSTRASRFLDEIDRSIVTELETDGLYREEIIESRSRNRKKERVVKKEDSRFNIGQLVKHPSFGVGEVTDKSGVDEELRLVVLFEGNVEKKLMVKYAKLKTL